MLDFLSRPGNYFENLQSNGFKARPNQRPKKHKRPGGSRPQPNAGGNAAQNNNNPLSGVTSLLANNPLTGALNNIAGDGSLSRKDFVYELTTWFRRAIWFLGFTAATTASAPLFLLTAGLALVFELVYNVTNARQYWQQVANYHRGSSFQDHSDVGNIDYVDRVFDEDEEFDYDNYRNSLNFLFGLPPSEYLT